MCFPEAWCLFAHKTIFMLPFFPLFMLACLLLPLTIDVYHYFCSHFCYILIACYQTGNEKFRYIGERKKVKQSIFSFLPSFVSRQACNILFFSNILLWGEQMGNWFLIFNAHSSLCKSDLEKMLFVWKILNLRTENWSKNFFECTFDAESEAKILVNALLMQKVKQNFY